MAGRLDPSRIPPPVRIGLASARVKQRGIVGEIDRLPKAAGSYFGPRTGVYASVPIMLRIQRKAGPNTQIATGAVKPLGMTRRKKGYPPVTTLPTAG
jgi:hypothetical protein